MQFDDPAFTFGLALAAGITAQVAARHLRVPGIVLLLVAGVLLGPDVANLVRPDTLGDGLGVIVGAAVALILFEGGMHLEIARLRGEALVIRRLITVGALVTGVGGTLAARYVMAWPWAVAIPFGTLVIVTGPTVITPLLRRIRVDRTVHTILEAEAVLIDPIGAIIAVVALEVVLAQELGSAARGLLGIPTRLVFGLVAGAAGGFLLAKALASRRLIPQGLDSVYALSFLLALYAACEAVLPESGIMAAPIAGLVVGNMPAHPSQELKEFKEQLTTMLVGLLFVLLAADVRLSEVTALGTRGVVTVGLLMVVVRPLTVAASTAGSRLEPRARAFLAWLGPRGIVAAAVASVFAEELTEQGVAEGLELRALVFLVIATTVLVQGLGGGLVATLLGVRRRSNVGFVIAGANALARALGSALRRAGEEVVLVDTDPGESAKATAAGLDSVVGNALDEDVLEQVDLEGRRGIVALIPNEGIGLMIAERARREFRVARADVAIRPGRLDIAEAGLRRIGAGLLFGAETDLEAWIRALSVGGAVVRSYRYVGATERAVTAAGGPDRADPSSLHVVVERRGRALPVNERTRLRKDDVVTVLEPVGYQAADPDFEPIGGALAGSG
jgi:NhaP-type Na+/H+ or K+/H+ antiporter/Trk K+ transport system NAD-binding subunit